MQSQNPSGRKKRPWKRWLGFGIVAVASIYVGRCFHNHHYLHTHCITQSHLYLVEFSSTHDGRFPESDRGFADALLKLSDGEPFWIPFFTNGKDEGNYFREALQTGGDIDESKCSRIYVQGLREDSNPAIAILFDTEAIQGGDHLYMVPGQPRLREVITIDGSMQKINEAQWPSFAAEQQKLLLEEGFSFEEIEKLYGAALPTPHHRESQ